MTIIVGLSEKSAQLTIYDRCENKNWWRLENYTANDRRVLWVYVYVFIYSRSKKFY